LFISVVLGWLAFLHCGTTQLDIKADNERKKQKRDHGDAEEQAEDPLSRFTKKRKL